MPTRARTAWTAAAAVAVVTLGGCGSLSADRSLRWAPTSPPRAATRRRAASGDPAARCGLLAPGTRTALEEEEATTCEEAVGQVPAGSGMVTGVEVWGLEAQVELSDDTLFLTRTSDGWRISAVACRARGEDRPYDCELAAS